MAEARRWLAWGQREVVRDSWHATATSSTYGTWACMSAWLTDFRADLPTIDVPTLIVHEDSGPGAA
jgi:non-heme chloroperoxidase